MIEKQKPEVLAPRCFCVGFRTCIRQLLNPKLFLFWTLSIALVLVTMMIVMQSRTTYIDVDKSEYFLMPFYTILIPFYVFCLRGSCRLFGRPHPFRSPGVVTSGDPSDTFHVSISRLQDLSVGCSELRNLGQQKFIRFTSYNFTCCFPWVQTKIFHICYGLGPNTWTIITISILCFKFHTELRALQHLKQKHEATFGHGTHRIPSIPATKMLGKARFRCLARPWGWGKWCEFWRASFFNAR